jgi:3-isopropylmalate dehydrogenase
MDINSITTRQSPTNGEAFPLRSYLSPDAGTRIPFRNGMPPLLGVIEGTGIGPQVIAAALHVLEAAQRVCSFEVQLRRGGAVGEEAESHYGNPLPESTADFFAEVLDARGAVLSGPGGGRYVYDLRKRFDLFCKFVPVRPWPQLARSGLIASENLGHVDLLIVRDNVGGVYQGDWQTRTTKEGQVAEHTFSYAESQVRRLAEVAARAASGRRGKMHVIVKDGGVPSITALWRDVGQAVARQHGIEAKFMNVDLAAYELIRNPSTFDVMLTPNLFGDILVDITGALLGSRGVTFSGNFDVLGNGVYQTNHGCAHDLAGADVANPAGQILSLAMLLRESFGLGDAAALMEKALAEAWSQGWRTADVAEPGCQVIGTRAMSEQVAQQVFRLAEMRETA